MPDYHKKKIYVDSRCTVHFKNPKNKILLEALAERDRAESLSSWLAEIIENEIIPNKLKGDKNK